MKDFSFVGIKLTKAKTISEGLTKCKIQKLTRQNPLYEHIKLHQLINGRKPCLLCSSLPLKTSPSSKKNGRKMQHAQTERSQTGLTARGKTVPLQPSTPQPNSPRKLTRHWRKYSQREASEGNLQVQAS